MTESAGMTLIAALVNGLSNFTSTGSTPNITIADWSVLNKGFSNHYAILRPGPTERPRISMRMRDTQYRTIIEVWQQYVNDGTTVVSVIGNADAIAAQIDKYRKLGDTGGTIRESDVSGFGEVRTWPADANTPTWLVREVYVDWKEESTPAYAE